LIKEQDMSGPTLCEVNMNVSRSPVRGVVALILSLFLISCAAPRTAQQYDGPPLDKSRIATISPAPGYNGLVRGRQDVYLLMIDGKELSKADRDGHAVFEVMPGEHSITVAAMLQRENQRVPFEDPNPIRYNFEAGKRYSVFCKMDDGPSPGQTVVRFWMEDETGKVVSGNN
jgi:hypothetical protein